MFIAGVVLAIVASLLGLAALIADFTRKAPIVAAVVLALGVVLCVLFWLGLLDWARPVFDGRILGAVTATVVAIVTFLSIRARWRQAGRWRDLRWPTPMTPATFDAASRSYFAPKGWTVQFEKADRWKLNYFLIKSEIKLAVIFANGEMQRSYDDERIANMVVTQGAEAMRASNLPVLFIANFWLKPRANGILATNDTLFIHFSDLGLLEEIFPIAVDRLAALPETTIAILRKIAPACDRLSKDFMAQGDRIKAIAWAQSTIEASPSDAEAQFRLCLLHVDDKNPVAAVEAAQNAVRLQPKRLLFTRKLIEITRASGDLAQAAEWAERGITHHPAVALLHDDLAVIRLAQNDFSGAETAARAAVALEPDKIRFYRRLTECLAKQGNLAAAIEVAGRAVAVAPDTIDIRNHLADLLIQAGDLAQAKVTLEDALGLAPIAGGTLRRLRIVATRSGDRAQAYAWSARLIAEADHTPADQAFHEKIKAQLPAS